MSLMLAWVELFAPLAGLLWVAFAGRGVMDRMGS